MGYHVAASVDDFVEKLKSAGAKDVSYVRIDGGNHGFVYEQYLDRTISAMDKFFERTLRPERQ
jgi:dipeptidyl aminopeptidase/acylaminoacyl peptidase